MVLPYVSVVETLDGVSRNQINDVLHRALAMSRTQPCSLELADASHQRFLFLREGQVYASGMIQGLQFSDCTIREFLLGVGKMNFPRLTWYALNSKILHSTLILFQKKPALRVLTSLVDLDEVLDKIETEGKSCIVCAARENSLALLRYERGVAKALCHEQTIGHPRESTFREEFLVRIYTITAQHPLTISIFEDLLVSYASDAKTIPNSFEGRFEELYLSKPPLVSLRFKGREIDHWLFDKPVLKIGRTPDNDIVIDNLAVSRLHAVLEEEKGRYYVRDCDSLNGTVVNGSKVGRARLDDGDEISIGKHTIVFRRQGGQTVPAEETIQGFDQTVIFERGAPRSNVATATAPAHKATAAAPASAPLAPPKPKVQGPRLIMKTEWGNRVIALDKDTLTIGKDLEADIAIEGFMVARRHAEIVCKKGRVIIRHVRGLRKVTVGGKSVRETELKNNDQIKIANEEFIFQS